MTVQCEAGCRAFVATLILLAMTSCDSGDFADPSLPIAMAPKSVALDSLTGSATSVDADGASQITLVAHVPNGVRDSVPSVSFSTTGGTFAGAPPGASTLTVNTDTGGRARAVLVAPTTQGTIYIQAKAMGTTLVSNVLATPALADTIIVSTARPTVTADRSTPDTITVTATLLRKVGAVSAGVGVQFSADSLIVDPVAVDKIKVGPVFTAPTVSGAGGTVTIRYSPGLTLYRGPVTIVAATRTSKGIASATTTIFVVAPPTAKSSVIQTSMQSNSPSARSVP